mgnify:CR=1 FL=1
MKLMKRIHIKKSRMESFGGGIYPKNKILSRECITEYSNSREYEVGCGIDRVFVIDLEKRSCTCRQF